MLRELTSIEENMLISKSVVRVGNSCKEDVPHFSTHGSNNVFVNGNPIARKSDNFTENKVLIQGSATVFANGLGIARVGDLVSCGFKIKNGSYSQVTKK